MTATHAMHGLAANPDEVDRWIEAMARCGVTVRGITACSEGDSAYVFGQFYASDQGAGPANAVRGLVRATFDELNP